MKKLTILMAVLLFLSKTVTTKKLSITRSNIEDKFEGHKCMKTSYNTGPGKCQCNFGLTTYFANHNSTLFRCQKTKELLSATGCKEFQRHNNNSNIIKTECVLNSIEYIEVWNYIEITRSGVWDTTLNNTLKQSLVVEKNNGIMIKENINTLDGLLLRIWVQCANERNKTCVLLAFTGKSTYPLDITELVQNKTTQKNETTQKEIVTSKGSTKWIMLGSIAAAVLILGLLVIIIAYKCVQNKRMRSFKVNNLEEQSSSTPSQLHTSTHPSEDTNADGIYKELDENYETNYKSLILESNKLHIGIDNKLFVPQKEHASVYHTLSADMEKKNEEPDYHELEPEYSELENGTYEEILPNALNNSANDNLYQEAEISVVDYTPLNLSVQNNATKKVK